MNIIDIINEEIQNYYSDWQQDEPSIADKIYSNKYGIETNKPTQQTSIDAELIGYVDKQYSNPLYPPVPVYKNPKSLVGFSDNTRGILMNNGDFYVAKTFNALHDNILDLLASKNIIPIASKFNYDKNYPEEFVAVQRASNLNIFGQSSAYEEFPDYYIEIFNIGNQKQPFEFNNWSMNKKNYNLDEKKLDHSFNEEKLNNIIKNEMESPLDPNNIQSNIPQDYQHNILDETYQSIDEIKNLANDILIEVARENFESINKDGQFKYLYGINLKYSDNSEYTEIKNFMTQSNIYVTFEPEKDSSRRGEYIHYSTPKNNKNKFNPYLERYINVFYKYDNLKQDIDEIIKEKGKITYQDLYMKIFYVFNKALIHELQHAYDDYRSKGQSFNSKEHEEYKKKYSKQLEDNILKSEQEDLKEYQNYLNLLHEIWARFSQSMLDVHFYSLDFSDSNGKMYLKYYMYPINDVIKKFGRHFNGYSILSDDMKNRLIRKVAQFWHIEQEKVKELNKKEQSKLNK